MRIKDGEEENPFTMKWLLILSVSLEPWMMKIKKKKEAFYVISLHMQLLEDW